MADFALKIDGLNTSLYHRPKPLDFSSSKKSRQSEEALTRSPTMYTIRLHFTNYFSNGRNMQQETVVVHK